MKRALTLLCLLSLLSLSACSRAGHDLTGTWEDVEDDSYRVQFTGQDTYKDTLYGITLSCTELEDNVLLYASPAGDMYFVPVSWTWGGNPVLEIGGMHRELRRVSDSDITAVYKDIDVNNLTSEYTLKSQLGVQSSLRVDDQNNAEFELNFGEPNEDNVNAISGKSAISTVSNLLTFYYEDGSESEEFRLSDSGSYISSLPLSVDGTISAEVSYSNPSLSQENGYTLDGTVFYPDGSIFYKFSSDGICTKEMYTGSSLEYSYYVDTDGLITLAAKGGNGSYDYMYYDHTTNTVYRLVYQRNSWQDYLSSLLYTEVLTEKESSTDYVVMPPQSKPATDDEPATNPLDSALGYCNLPVFELESTNKVMQEIQDIQDSIKEDDIARREYELSLLSEQERLIAQAKAVQEERARLQALMDARVQAEIESGRGSPPASKSPDWWDDFLSQIDGSTSYDQDEQVSSPVVNSHTPENTSGGDSTKPSAWPTNPITETTASPEPTASNDKVALTVTFVCTCVNCHVQSMPVEVGADNVLLVDSSIFTPGNLLNIEGYGVVTSRASGGTTSGQTAICYSGSHNAVSRFPSGVYSVSKVVG